MKGKCKWFNAKKGYGFITGEDNKDVFVHFSGIVMDGYKLLKENQAVEFEVVTTGKGSQAINVKPLVNLNEVKPELNKTSISD
jgi:cold shock protein